MKIEKIILDELNKIYIFIGNEPECKIEFDKEKIAKSIATKIQTLDREEVKKIIHKYTIEFDNMIPFGSAWDRTVLMNDCIDQICSLAVPEREVIAKGKMVKNVLYFPNGGASEGIMFSGAIFNKYDDKKIKLIIESEEK